MLGSVRRVVRFYFHMAGASIRSQMQYRYAFFMNILGWAMSYAGTAITMWTILYQFKALAGWSFWELLFLFALAVLSWGICVMFFFHFRSLDQYIVNGTFDRFLVRPIHPFLHFISLKFDVGAFGQLIFSILAMWLAYAKLHLDWEWWRWLAFLGAMIGGTLIQGGILVAIAAIAFWTTRSERFYWVVMFPAKSMMNYPISIYPKLVQWIVTFLFPFAFVNYYPALFLLGKSNQAWERALGVISPFIGCLFFALCFWIWSIGMNRYKSAGS